MRSPLHKFRRHFLSRAHRVNGYVGDRDLAALRSHQRYLLFVGGGLLSAAIVGALLAVMALRVKDFREDSIDEYNRGRLAFNALLVRREGGYERMLNMAEYTWRHRRESNREISRKQRMSFIAQRERAAISAGEDSATQTALGLGTDRWAESKLEYYLDLTESLSVITRTSTTELDQEFDKVSYFYEPSGKFFALNYGLDEPQLQQVLGTPDRATLFAKLKALGDRPTIASPSPDSARAPFGVNIDPSIRTFYGINPANGKPAIGSAFRGYDDGKSFGTFVTFEPTERFSRALQEVSDGTFLVIAPGGQLVLGTHPVTGRALDLVALAKAKIRSSSHHGPSVHWSQGRFFIVDVVRGTDWLLVHTYTWQDVLREIWRGMVGDSVVAAIVLIGLWSLLVRMDRRVFAPAMERASRVYQSEEVSRTLVEMAPIGLCLIDADHVCVVEQNDMVRDYAASVERKGDSLYQRLVDVFATAPSMLAGPPLAREFEMAIPDVEGGGERQLIVVMVRATYQNRPVFLCAMRDRTARAELERQQHRARLEAESAARAKSTFVAAMSHEIRTPFHGILGHLELLANSHLEEGQLERLRHIRQSADSLLSIISDILDFSKIESGQLDIDHVSFEPRALVERVALLYAPLAQARGLDLDFRLDGAVGQSYRGGMAHIEQVLRNLVNNALKFTPSGRVAVRVSPEFNAEGEVLRFEVVDSGVGLSEEQLQRLFQAFAQADSTISRRYGGTGLGLYLCRRLCELMGGRIEVRSTVGVGSAFSFEVPVTRLESGPRPEPLHGLRVLVVSSAAKWRDELGQRLVGWGAEVRLAADTSELEREDVESAAAVVAFERPGQDWDPKGNWSALARRLILVHVDGSLSPVWIGNTAVVSCYSGEALLQALLGRLARETFLHTPCEQPIS